MPLVDFKCNNCGLNARDKIVKDTTTATRECVVCGQTMRPVVATTGSFVLEGRSWAKDGYS